MESSTLQLDATTIVFSISMLALFMAALSFILGSGTPRRDSGLREWGVSMTLCAGAFLLFFFSNLGPRVLTFLVANALVMAALPYGLLAHTKLFEVPAPRRAITVVTVFGMSGVLATYFLDASRGFAIFTLSLGMAMQVVLLAVLTRKNINKRTTPLAWLALFAMVLLAAAFTMRAMLAMFGDAALVTPAASSMPQIGALFMGGIFIAVSSIGFIAMVTERQHREAIDRMRRDGLTGLYTRSAFFEMAEMIEKIGTTEGYALIYVDIDHFKVVNDTFGHAGGDVTLAHAARLISSSIRLHDIAVRYGGEEFCVLLHGCGEAEAAKFAENLVAKAALQTVRLRDGQCTQFTLSAGYACKSTEDDVETLDSVIERADQALYRAKREGRNRAFAAAPRAQEKPVLLAEPLLQV